MSALARLAAVAAVTIGGLLLIPASPFNTTAVVMAAECNVPHIYLSEPECQTGDLDRRHAVDNWDLNTEAGCVVTGTGMLGLAPEVAISSCAARMVALEKHQLAVLAMILDPTPAKGLLDTEDECMAFARRNFVVVEDAAKACAIRMTLIAEGEQGASGQATAGNGSQNSQVVPPQTGSQPAANPPGGTDNRKACEEIADQVVKLTDAMFTPQWNALGGDAEFNRLEAEFKARNCQEVLK